MNKNDLAVVYLARPETGISHIRDYVKSYKEYASGVEHDLIIILKGVRKYGEEVYIRNLFDYLNAIFVIIPDDGFDIHAYINITKSTDYKYYLFCNTYTVINTDNWLKKITQYCDDKVGLIGTSASYESLLDSWRVMQKVNWLITEKHIKYDEDFAKKYAFYINHLVPNWMTIKGFSFRGLYKNLRRKVFDLIKNRPLLNPSLDLEFDEVWTNALKTEKTFQFLKDFPSFPNPHIRSTGFLIAKSVLQRFNFNLKNSKEACAIFESGHNSLSSLIIKAGLTVLVVNSDGIAYDIEDWEDSQTFRISGIQKNIFLDNHSASWNSESKESQNLLRELTWGSHDYQRDKNIVQIGSEIQKVSISIVLPTHNRNSLVKDALFTILQQKTASVEVIVFDNYSDTPLCDSLHEYIGDINVYRSDRFLSVTESWNAAINFATGDYVILLGDDDGLLPSAVKYISNIILNYSFPDMIYAPIVQFFHPSVAPWKPEGYVTLVKNGSFFENLCSPRFLPRSEAESLVEGSLVFQRSFSFNMQAMIFRRKFLDQLRVNGSIFQTPFPDYYLANLAFYTANKLLIINRPFAIQGVSRPSFGYTLFNDLESKGEQLLNNPPLENYDDKVLLYNILPGSGYNTNYLITMYFLSKKINCKNFISVDFKKYRMIQISLLIKKFKSFNNIMKTIKNSNKNFNFTLKELFTIYLTTINLNLRIYKKIISIILIRMENVTKYNAKVIDIDDGNCATIIDLYNLIMFKKWGVINDD